jgi:hypothetical protein
METQFTYDHGLSVNIREASQELASLIEKLERSRWKTDDALLESELEAIIWHLAAAWNARFNSLTAMNDLPPNDFKALGSAIPNFGGQFYLKSPTNSITSSIEHKQPRL